LKKKKIGLLGGTFDPIHLGHLNLAVEVLERKKLDGLLLCPAYISPGKLHVPPTASPQHRWNMVSLAIEGLASFGAIDQEINRPSPSYTIDTVKRLVNEEVSLFLILSEEVAYTLPSWKQCGQLLTMVSLIVGATSPLPLSSPSLSPPVMEKIKQGWCPISVMEISSRNIRNRLAHHLCCDHLIPRKVLDYIYQHRLYCSPEGEL